MAGNDNGTVDFRVLTANIQSVPEDAITLGQASEDLRRNAKAADIVLLQEIADRYHDLVVKAFPEPEWEVFFGDNGNSEPIAFRRSMFRLIDGHTTPLHPPRAGIHGRRLITQVHLSAEPEGAEFYVTNLHMVAKAFSDPNVEHRALRVREWTQGIAKHIILVDKLVESGVPVLGGGDYNRQLKRHPSLGKEIAGRKVKYAVDPGSIDLLWFVDGDKERWSLRSKDVFHDRNSDHAARLANVQLSSNGSGPLGPDFVEASNGFHAPSSNGQPKNKHKNGAKPKKKAKVKAKVKAKTRQHKWHPPFDKTEFGDGDPKTVDWKTRVALEEAERILGYPLSLTQGSYNPNKVKASAHTHDLGGVVDLKPFEAARKVRVLRSIGFAAWHRLPSQGPWVEHVHAVMVDHGNLHPEAAKQVDDYRKGLNGLANHAKDPTPRPHPIPVFKYPPKTAHHADASESVAGHHDNQGHQAKVGQGKPTIEHIGPAYPTKRTLDGVDTSHYQTGKIDLRIAQHAGLRWWYVKTTEGSTLKDKTYRKRIREARRAGVPVGSYHLASPDGGDAVKEANYFLKNSDIRLGDMLPMLDLEGRRVLNRAELTRWVGVWVTTVRGDLARRGLVGNPIIYTQFDLDDAFGCKLWVSRYSNEFQPPRIPEPWKRAAIWQHSDGKIGPIQNVPGFGHVDVSAMHPELPLSALRVRRPGNGKGGNEMDLIRRDLEAARKRIDDALKRLPER